MIFSIVWCEDSFLFTTTARFATMECITSMYIPGLECTFITAEKDRALLRINSPDNIITAVSVYRINNMLRFVITTKVKKITEPIFELKKVLESPLQCSSGRIITDDEFFLTIYSDSSNSSYWQMLFAEQSREFIPFSRRVKVMLSVTVTYVADAEVGDVITAFLGVIGFLRDDVDTKPARAC
jgi:hypothetical protein